MFSNTDISKKPIAEEVKLSGVKRDRKGNPIIPSQPHPVATKPNAGYDQTRYAHTYQQTCFQVE